MPAICTFLCVLHHTTICQQLRHRLHCMPAIFFCCLVPAGTPTIVPQFPKHGIVLAKFVSWFTRAVVPTIATTRFPQYPTPLRKHFYIPVFRVWLFYHHDTPQHNAAPQALRAARAFNHLHYYTLTPTPYAFSIHHFLRRTRTTTCTLQLPGRMQDYRFFVGLTALHTHEQFVLDCLFCC